jgi:SAM-dependent methyltransferase
MPDSREVYRFHPEDYDALVRCEDRDGNLLKALREIVPLGGKDVVELGAGTGRLTLLVAPQVRSVQAFDAAAPMLAVAQRHLARLGLGNCTTSVADNGELPLRDACADVALAGWTYGHQTVWDEAGWRRPIERALREMLRVLRPGGTAIVIETLGTGHLTPFDPPTELGRYYALLEEEWGFARRWIRTDYEFPSLAEGERLVRFFFGDERARRFATEASTTLPECTGIWWRRSGASPRPMGPKGERI